jgi:hypothetical protein
VSTSCLCSHRSLKPFQCVFKRRLLDLFPQWLSSGIALPGVYRNEDIVVVFGLILLIIGFVLKINFLWSLGVIVLLIGLVLWIMGALGHAVGGRKHYY